MANRRRFFERAASALDAQDRQWALLHLHLDGSPHGRHPGGASHAGEGVLDWLAPARGSRQHASVAARPSLSPSPR